MKNVSVLCLVLTSMVVFSQKKWELATNSNDIKIYTRKIDSTAFKEYLATTIINAPIDSISKKITDIKKLHLWNYKTTANTILKKPNDSTWVIYMQNNLDWPVKDRDHVSKVVLYKKKTEQFIYLTPENNFLKTKSNLIRIKKFKGFWHLKKITENKTQVSQQMYGNPEGNLPAVLVNTMLTKAPLETFKKLKQQLEK